MSLSSYPESPAAIIKENLSRLELAAHEAASPLTVDYMSALALRPAQDSAAFVLAKLNREMPPKPVSGWAQLRDSSVAVQG
jgi:hypothetical protein